MFQGILPVQGSSNFQKPHGSAGVGEDAAERQGIPNALLKPTKRTTSISGFISVFPVQATQTSLRGLQNGYSAGATVSDCLSMWLRQAHQEKYQTSSEAHCKYLQAHWQMLSLRLTYRLCMCILYVFIVCVYIIHVYIW